MAGRRRVRLAAAVVVFIVIVIIYTRQGQGEHYGGHLTDTLVGGGSVLREKPEVQQPAALPKSSVPVDARPTALAGDAGAQSTTAQDRVTSDEESRPEATSSSTPTSSFAAAPESTSAPVHQLPPITHDDELPYEYGEGRVEVSKISQSSAVHWTSFPENFPVSSTIQLPTGTPASIPSVQYTGTEHDFGHADEDRLAAVKAAAQHAWQGYREVAFGADEVKPISGGINNPFNGWGATLVDSLDTLWIMGLTSAFDEAVEAVADIDFTTSPRSDIPLFEVTIRYLGGLIAAYDLSGQQSQHRVLLDKAVELGEILYAAFDTPNRMPMTYYRWKPAFASQPHRAGSRVVMAELGSLSMEFTRLAMLTGEPKYYDAIARITDELEQFQNNTRLPGMWPTSLDASGCAKPAQMAGSPVGSGAGLRGGQQYFSNGNGEAQVGPPVRQGEDGLNYAERASKSRQDQKAAQADLSIASKQRQPYSGSIHGSGSGLVGEDLTQKGESDLRHDFGSTKRKRQLEIPSLRGLSQAEKDELISASSSNATAHKPELRAPPESNRDPLTGAETCEPSGLHSVTRLSAETFTLGGQSDSTYEYLPKEYLLLGGLVDQYRTMYEDSMEAVKEELLFKPMTIDERDVLISGELKISINYTDGELIKMFQSNGEHLTCFAGGMFALGGVIFDRPEDVEIGRKLTDGCIWAYNSTTTGIMPEGFTAAMCPGRWDEPCEWNQTEYWHLLDPYEATRTRMPSVPQFQAHIPATTAKPNGADATSPPKVRQGLHEEDLDDAEMADTVAATSSVRPAPNVEVEKQDSEKAVYRRQLDEAAAAPAQSSTKPLEPAAESTTPSRVIPAQSARAAAGRLSSPMYTPKAPLSHAEYVEKKIEDERLPPGMTKIGGRKYILRPEAIESVFYLYRITGDPYFRDMGWKMFTSIDQHTRALYGASAIDDVTKAAPEQIDSMESFWTAETLKYFYLLFDEPNRWSLDEWVLNTEAHFFRRPS
ncbi:seven-hairpin glycosidase [Hortaea werneckii]|uniref:alpha-1,2-Mannosidase n=1 Tax=Hortaea werneckii TaxID=91943 RepID=A0A3M7HW15_HORWE|nr:seven-hairpin glycosidase [Hortaea werneckii]KAI6941063.1 seven-hairpin glycosidase [Hortaea werneckii]KAI6982058.1 seven-hairpin glycosidase [Hortaea werneckii]KAI6997436.1 seven-hairpin glycosidase [Hortaea werneckii]KAI7049989.1 seven-hairpin glycosidase [Hortaea werneckii]